MIVRSDLDLFACQSLDQNIALRNRNAAERFNAFGRTQKAGHSVQRIDAGIENRPNILSVEDRWIAGVCAPTGRTNVCHLPDSKGRRTKPAVTENLLDPAESLGRHHGWSAKKQSLALFGEGDQLLSFRHAGGQWFLRKNVQSVIERCHRCIAVERRRREIEYRGQAWSREHFLIR